MQVLQQRGPVGLVFIQEIQVRRIVSARDETVIKRLGQCSKVGVLTATKAVPNQFSNNQVAEDRGIMRGVRGNVEEAISGLLVEFSGRVRAIGGNGDLQVEEHATAAVGDRIQLNRSTLAVEQPNDVVLDGAVADDEEVIEVSSIILRPQGNAGDLNVAENDVGVQDGDRSAHGGTSKLMVDGRHKLGVVVLEYPLKKIAHQVDVIRTRHELSVLVDSKEVQEEVPYSMQTEINRDGWVQTCHIGTYDN